MEFMNIRLLCQIRTSLIVVVLTSSAVTAQSPSVNHLKTPPVPPNLQAPTGNIAFLEGHAVGTQNYVCLPSASGFSWTFFSPQATLFTNLKWINGDFRQQIITHFFSPNPFENDTSRATWQSSFDTSAVWGKSVASTSDPNFVAPNAIPWLLLQVVGAQSGPTEGAILTPTTFVQRLNTSGGVAPSTGCSAASNIGSTALVFYTADYFFYKASR